MTQIYLISPPKINSNFAADLNIALATNHIGLFQLRLKDYQDDDAIKIGKELLEICRKNQTPFILNDRLDLALKIGADGVHIGSEDGDLEFIKNNAPKNFIVGVSCYDSRELALNAAKNGVDYVSFGTFFPSKTKNSIGKPNPEILSWCKKTLNIKSVAIGGITPENSPKLVEAGADFLAVISYIWENQAGIKQAIDNLHNSLS
ncbi:MAG: thiamine-phosphate diphosphorylase [Rickettsiaceae bacterium]|jgi:thiamine-phosphate pyrophosphorylase|nr:thiamine-phosphate diphosphorylase [Rickettsiaceae bacterium]